MVSGFQLHSMAKIVCLQTDQGLTDSITNISYRQKHTVAIFKDTNEHKHLFLMTVIYLNIILSGMYETPSLFIIITKKVIIPTEVQCSRYYN